MRGSLARLVGQLTAAERPARVRLLASLAASVNDLLSDSTEADRQQLARIATRGEPGTAPLIAWLPRLLCDPSPDVAGAAGQALVALAGRVAGLEPAEQEAALAAAAEGAQGLPDHRRREVVEAAALVLTTPGAVACCGALRVLLADTDHPIHSELRTVIRRTTGDAGLARAAALLKYPTLSAACASRLRDAAAAAGWPAGRAGPWPLDHPQRRSALRRMRMGGTIDAAATGPGACPAGVRLERCFDADGRVARSAAIASIPDMLPEGPCWGLGPAWGARVITSLSMSPHETVREVARAAAERRGVRPSAGPAARIGFRRLMEEDRAAVIGALREEVASPSPTRAVEGLRLASDLGLVDDLFDVIAGLTRPASGADARVAATAARSLGLSTLVEAGGVLEACLGHPDSRVRANAAEAMASRALRADAAADTAALFEAHWADEHPRLRAVSIRGCLRLHPSGSVGARAVAALSAMLSDERPEHRLSAAWAAERAGDPAFWRRWGDLAGRLARAATADPHPAVRRRAASAAATVAATIRAGWSGVMDERQPWPVGAISRTIGLPAEAGAARRAVAGPGPA
jgi:hypothetical protein